MENTLDKLKVNEQAVVKEVLEDSPMRRRFLDIGLAKGTDVECRLASFGEEMKAYRIKGALIGIRKEDAKGVLVEERRK